MKKSLFLIALLTLTVYSFASPKKAVRERSVESVKAAEWLDEAAPEQVTYAKDAAENRVLVPFSIVSMHARNHIIAWFDGHPEYESVEAFVYGNGRVRAILTKHDNAQIDVFNYEGFDPPSDKAGRSWYKGAVSFSLADDKLGAMLAVEMPDGQELTLSYQGQSAPDSEYGGITDPGLHAPDGGLPAFYRDSSSVSSERSFVKIGAKKYRVPVDKNISLPPYFTAYAAFLSEGYASFIMPTFSDTRRVALRSTAAESRVSLRTGVTDNRIVTAEREGVAETKAIFSSSDDISGTGYHTELRFNPPLANLYALGDGCTASSRFAVFFDDCASEEVYGTITIEKKGRTATVHFRPEYPQWAKEARNIRYALQLDSDGAEVSAAME